MAGIVYLATNRLNGKRYVGATIRGLARRRGEHEREAMRGGENCRLFHRAIRKNKPDSFDWLILVECGGLEEALLEERRLIAEIRPEYNLKSGGQGSTTPRIMSAESKERWRSKMVGRKYGPEFGEKIRQAHLGKKRSAEARANMSAARKGIKFSESQLKNMSLAQLGRKQSAETIEKRAATRRGRPLSIEHRAKVSAALTGRKRPPHVGLAVAASNRARSRSSAQLEIGL